MADDIWRFALDVGGTFTDCVAVAPDGSSRTLKVLSSGVVKGRVGDGSTATSIVDPARDEMDGFWRGAGLRIVNSAGAVVGASTIVRSASGRLELAAPLPCPVVVGDAFELIAGYEAPLLAIHLALGCPLDQPLPPCEVRLGTTRGTNALLTRRGARTALVTTRGFADLWEIGYQNRPRLFDVTIRKPPPLYATTVEVDERVAADGAVLRPIDAVALREQLVRLHADGIDSVAVCLLHACRRPDHERLVGRLARDAGFAHVRLSHESAAVHKAIPRGDTTLVDAYLDPILREYLAAVAAKLPGSDLKLMTSSGALTRPEDFRGSQSVLSGPAGGVVGCARVAQGAGFAQAIGFDMGGTSTDVSRWAGMFDLEHETEKAGVRLATPTLAIETIASGGGSICGFDGAMLTVGPDSAGAEPGPACYGRGGPLTITDVNLWSGRLAEERFPFPLDKAAVGRRLDELIAQVVAAGGTRFDRDALADGLRSIADQQMAAAVRSISVARGFDPREAALVPFGSAGPQHACAVADAVEITTIVDDPRAGVLSAVGVGAAEIARHASQAIQTPLEAATWETLRAVRGEVVADARDALASAADVVTSVRIELRHPGTERPLAIDWRQADSPATLAARFFERHRALYGFAREERPLEATAIRATAIIPSEPPPRLARANSTRCAMSPVRRPLRVAGTWIDAPRHDRDALALGDLVVGPATIVGALSTKVVDDGWQAEVLGDGTLLLTRTASKRTHSISHEAPLDPIELQIARQRFAAIAEQMGHVLRNTSTSVNVRERLDFSCALFTAEGALIANAPHVPVHLGAMGETVRAILREFPRIAPGDVFVTNDPFRGGSHLPDVTVVTPVFSDSPPTLRMFTASRAHHAEIGGKTPGSMPPDSTCLADEGVLLEPFKLFDSGAERYDELRRRLTEAPYPSRAVEDNLADVAAQVAANRAGAVACQRWASETTWTRLAQAMRDVQSAAERKTRAALSRISTGRRRFVDHLDDGSPIVVAAEFHGDSVTIDFTGTGPVLSGNLNANRAIVGSAVIYTLRCLLAEDVPLNEGVLAPAKIILPPCLLNPPGDGPPDHRPAVVGGNVETSQRVVDALFGAFGLAAASQGTMNNLLFGDDTFGYYETVCGGAGATSAGPGASAVHTHMTNTRLTDPETLESRFPVRLRRFAVRRDSGGAGLHRGGDGVIRELEFLRPVVVSLLTQRRGPFAPYGWDGGSPGALGANTLLKADGTSHVLPAIVRVNVAAGDVIWVETPGGGGWGSR